MRYTNRNKLNAFTLIELLVVVAIIAMLLAILLPSLKCARASARASACGTTMRSFGTGLGTYFAENDDWIPGINTSSVALRAIDRVESFYNPKLPVQTFDWMTPIVCYDTELPGKRADRFKFLLNHFRCPSQVAYNSMIFPNNIGSAPDSGDFNLEDQDWTAVSYLMPAHFQWWGQAEKGRVLGSHQTLGSWYVYSVSGGEEWAVVVPSYRSRLAEIGNPARKVAVADGTRYLTESGIIDHDVVPLTQNFGSFGSNGAFWCGSQAYGPEQGSANWDGQTVNAGSWPEGRGRGMLMSYRHGCTNRASMARGAQDNGGEINALFFDGHVDRLDDRKSREPHLWYPKGSIVQTPSQGMVATEPDEIIH